MVRMERNMRFHVILCTHILAFVCSVMSGIWPMTYAVLSVLSALEDL
jgi:hypothetical protein